MASRQTLLIEGNDVEVDVWHMAVCQECGADVAQPFTDKVARNMWAARHVAGTGHTVRYATRIDVTAS